MIEELSPPSEVSMADEWFELATVDHFWIEWRFREILRYQSLLPKSGSEVLEIGCGSGTFLKQLAHALPALRLVACDLNAKALEQIPTGIAKLFCYNILDCHPRLQNRFSAIFLLDVIEHIDDDLEFVCAASKHLDSGGLAVINVPALPWLFSRYDTVAGHKRRYSSEMLRSLLAASGLSLIKLSYWGCSMIPFLAARKLAMPFFPQNKVIEAGFRPGSQLITLALSSLMKAETSLSRTPPLGTSLLAFAQKR